MWRARPAKTHPLVWRHRSGRRSLVLGATASHVDGMDLEEGRALLAELLAWSTSPDRVFRHEWSVGDMVIWDNRGVLHRALPYDASSAARHAPHDDLRRRADLNERAGTEPRITPLPHATNGRRRSVAAIAALMPPGVDRPLRRRKGGSKGHNVLGTLARHPQLMHALPHLQRTHPVHVVAQPRGSESCSSCASPRCAMRSTSGSSTWYSQRRRVSTATRSPASPTVRTHRDGRRRTRRWSVPSTN